MSITLADTIRETTREHLVKSKSLLFAQNVTAVGWIANTVPSDIPNNEGIVELPTSDCSNSAIVVGAALAKLFPIYVIRYQGFLWYNAASIVNYAAKSWQMWGVSCPMLIRGLAMEGGIGPVASHAHHSMLMRMPGLAVFAPITPNEWMAAWNFMYEYRTPVFVSEHRKTYQLTNDSLAELEVRHDKPKVTVVGISYARVAAAAAAKKSTIPFNTYGINVLSPLNIPNEIIDELKQTKLGVVVDCDYNKCGASEHIALDLSLRTGAKVYALGLDDRIAGFSKDADVLTPSPDKIKRFVEDIVKIND